MRARTLARTTWAVTVLLVAGALVLGVANRQGVPVYDVQSTFIAPTFATLGAPILVRRPGNVIDRCAGVRRTLPLSGGLE